eukprot:PhF_6_TR4511/c2_g1_i1/m.6281
MAERGERGGDRGGDRRGGQRRDGGDRRGGGDRDRDLPGLPKPPSPPDRSNLDSKIRKKRDEIQKYRTRLSTISEKMNNREPDPAMEAFLIQQRELTSEMNKVQDTIRNERTKRAGITKQMRETRDIRDDLENKLRDLTGELGAFKDIDDIKIAISHVERKMETEGAGSLKQEKEFLRRRKLLEAAKEQVLLLEPLRGQIDLCSEKETESLGEAKVIQARLNELNSKLKEIADAKAALPQPPRRQDDFKILKKERDELRQKLAECHEEIDKARDEFREEEKIHREKMDAWRVQLEAAKAERDKERQRRDEERAKRQAEKEAEIAELKKLNPYEAEIDLCNTLIRYLQEKVSSGKAQPRRPQTAEVRVDPELSLFKGRPDDVNPNSDWLFEDRRKKLGMGKTNSKPKTEAAKKESAPAANAAPKDRPLTLDIHRMLSFERLGMPAPTTTSQAVKLIEELKDKKKYYETFVRDEAPAVTSPSKAATTEEATPATTAE